MDKIRNYLTFKRVSSILLMILLVIGMININYKKTNAAVNKPEITVTGPEVNPQEPMEGQGVEVKYKLTPQPFEYNIPKPKEIVLVLDKSGSMENNKKMENLKTAAINFIDSLTQIDTKTNKPKVTDLKVGIISYDESGNIESDLIELTKTDSVNTTNRDSLKTIIDNLNADGGTNTGDGLRKGAYLLNKGSENANKTIIFMGDGEPTYYSYYNSWFQSYYYTSLDAKNPKEEKWYNSEPYLGGDGNKDSNGKSLEYAKIIGDIIKNKNYNIFSIGYGLGDANSSGNIKMKEIHTSMGGIIGGEKNSFFATDSDAIDSVFGKIADKLIDSYTFSDVMLDVKLNSPIEAVDGIEVDGVKAEPIVYQLKDNYWYTANEVEVVFKVKANEYGKILLFDNTYNNKLKYKGIDGNMIEVPLSNPEINIKPYNLDEGKKLNILAPQQINALIGDTINYNVNIKHPGIDSMNYKNVKYNISEGFPDILQLSSGNLINTFDSISKGENKVIENKFTVKNNENIAIDNSKSYDITGKYEYIANEKNISKNVSESLKTQLNIKRSQLRVNIVDKNDKPITGDFSVNIKGGVIDKTSSKVENGYLVFDTLPTFDYEVILKSVPNGYEIPETNNAIVKVNYDNNNPVYTFKLQGDGEEIQTINILEIQPADSFRISTSNGRVKSGTETSEIKTSGRTVKTVIDHISMPEFIGRVDKLNGKYDVIVIGRYVDQYFTSNLTGEDKQQYKYRDYFYTRGSNNEENDITNLKSKEIIEFINSNQLVYADYRIFNNAINTSDLRTDSKLYRNLVNNSSNRDSEIPKIVGENFITDKTTSNSTKNVNGKDISQLTLETIVKDYLKLENDEKGFNLEILSKPVSDNIEGEFGNPDNRQLKFNLNISNKNNTEELVDVNLYLDINGDGLFKEDEVIRESSKGSIKLPESNLNMTYTMDENFIGVLDWKIEVVRKDKNIKTYIKDSVLLRKLKDKKVINVLQVTTVSESDLKKADGKGNINNDNKYSVLDLSKNTRFKDLLKEVKDYDIKIKTISIDTLNKISNNGSIDGSVLSSEEIQKIKNLNGNYNMVILGFRDSYGNSNPQVNENAMNMIKSFIKTGQGLMLTHDTLFYTNPSSYTKLPLTGNGYIDTFRHSIGQSRYQDIKGITVNDIYGNSILHDPDKDNSEYRNNLTNSNYNADKAKAMGTTFWIQGGDGTNILNTLSTEVKKINEALITQYPFALNNEIRIRRTHGQYFQLNLEDEDVVPWFTFTNNNSGDSNGSESKNSRDNQVNKYDIRNNYYTYSRGNITFSGTGEETREYIQYPDTELRLFINTIVKAERGANHAPTIEALSEDSTTLIPVGEEYNFNAIIRDIDSDKVKINSIKLYDNNGNEKKNSIESIPNQNEDIYYDSGFITKVKVNKNSLNKAGEELTLKIEAEDKKGAKVEKSYKIKPVNEAIITADDLTISGLNGDVIPFKIVLNKINNSGNQISNISVEANSSTIADLFDLKIINQDYIEGKIKLKTTITSQSIDLIVKYNNNFGNREKRVKVIISSKEGVVNLVVTGINGSDVSDKINSVDLGNKIAPVYDSNLKQYSFKPITSGNYNLKVNYDSNKYYLQYKNTNDIVPSTGEQVSLSYDNNVVTKEYTLISTATNLKHGLYNSVANNNLNVTEGSVQLVRGSTANIAIGLTVMSNNTSLSFEIDEGIKNKEIVGLYKIVGNNIESITGQGLFKVNGNKYEVNLPSSITSETKLVVLYKCRVPEISDSSKTEFINKVFINGTEIENKRFSIKTTTNENKEILLPDLF